MHTLRVLDLDYLESDDNYLIKGGAFYAPIVSVKTETKVDTKVKNSISISSAPNVGLSYNVGIASGVATGLAVSVNGQSRLDVNVATSIDY